MLAVMPLIVAFSHLALGVITSPSYTAFLLLRQMSNLALMLHDYVEPAIA
jgi:hypothetical protein